MSWLDMNGANAVTPSELGGAEIHLGPAAFTSEEMLARTLGHEWTHVLQLQSGVVVGTDILDELEAEAYASEQQYVDMLLGGGS